VVVGSPGGVFVVSKSTKNNPLLLGQVSDGAATERRRPPFTAYTTPVADTSAQMLLAEHGSDSDDEGSIELHGPFPGPAAASFAAATAFAARLRNVDGKVPIFASALTPSKAPF
jgi:hypothetical protein